MFIKFDHKNNENTQPKQNVTHEKQVVFSFNFFLYKNAE